MKLFCKVVREHLKDLQWAGLITRKPVIWYLAELVRLQVNAKKLLFHSKEKWKPILTANNLALGKLNIKRGIFKLMLFSHYFFFIVLIPLSIKLREVQCGYQLKKCSIKINHLVLLGDFKLYGKNEQQNQSVSSRSHSI